MARVDEATMETWRVMTAMVLLDVRSAYLKAGASPLKHWDQILDRMRAAARTSGSVEEWHTSMCRSLQLGATSNSASSLLVELRTHVGSARGAWLDMIEREHGLLMAMARLEAERRKEARVGGTVTETMEGLDDA